MEWVAVAVATVFGALFGSFANVPIHRWPNGGTVGQPARSQCPACDAPIRPRDNIPVVSWLLLRGRCRDCGAAIPARYALVEALMALLFGAAVLVHGLAVYSLVALVFVWSAVVASVIDLEHRIIPNRLTLRLPLVLLPLLAVDAVLVGDVRSLIRAVIAGVAIPGLMLGLSELFRLTRKKQGIGMGDIKFAISIGLVVGYLGGWYLVVFAYGTIFSAALIVIALLVARRTNLAARIPFGPYLAVGALIALLLGDPAVNVVRGFLGL